ncbi:aliphatic sulfonate ABC transporter substrate-binding protein [Entomohabitans teleogrylli]|uniref:aliphatic sulfonate ABC transporter substrate-binding protein n=1 Tax=Entomohabitans teleogrylli TaxID=1384589 RepID=UPI00073D52A4|nr:aliphatic sulfonate ABC transporter substrate-binding protein [Entomohabitans teleogrylli]
MQNLHHGQTDTPELVDPASRAFRNLLDRLAPTDATVLIVGETGTGKEVVARYLHHHSPRRHQPFLAVNCGALSESLAEAELFGHEKGAFTGAAQSRPGWFEAAEGGTLLLDEIGELSMALQVKLLRVLQEREITRVGSRKPVRINVRVIAATHVDLLQAIRERRFREDLWYRLNIAAVELPPLRQRREDIPVLASHFLALYARRLGRPTRRLAPETLDALVEYSWPGNVRELENTLHNAVLLSKEEIITPDQLRLNVYAEKTPRAHPQDDIAEVLQRLLVGGQPQAWQHVTRTLLNSALSLCDGNQTQAAAMLGISRNTLRTQLANQGVIRPRRKPAGAAIAFVPQGRELRIGYQKFGNLGMLKARQTLEQALAPLNVDVLWSEFPAGPQLLHALQHHDIDFGATGEVPPIFAQASGSSLQYVAWEPPAPDSVALVVPQTSSIRAPEDLRGKRIAVNRGSNVHWLLMQLLDEAGLSQDEVRIVYTPPRIPLTPSDYRAVDAWMMWDPLLSDALSEGTLRVVANGQRRVNNHLFYLASREWAGQNQDVMPLLLAALQQSGQFIDRERRQAAALLAGELNLSAAALEQALARRSHQTQTMDSQIVREQQRIADRFYALGLIPTPVRIRDAVWQSPVPLAVDQH